MKKLRYLFSRIRNMDYKNMLRQASVVHKRTGKNTLYIFCDMVVCGFKYMAGYMDYVVFEFYNLNAAQRKTQVTRGINNSVVSRLNRKDSWYKFEDKVTFNRLFKDYVKRDWLDLKEATFEQFDHFVRENKTVIVKPTDGLCGKGVEKLSQKDFADIRAMYDYCKGNGQYLVEQLVHQHSELMRLFPNSVNTIRLVTILYHDKVSVVFSGIRIGVGNSVVDNINSGGMAAVIDVETGCISTDAADKDGKIFEKHPDTGTKIKGFAIPHFDLALDMVRQAARVVPEIGYAAWDVAITQEGALLIEGNHFPGHDIYQMPALITNGYGLLPVLQAAMRDE